MSDFQRGDVVEVVNPEPEGVRGTVVRHADPFNVGESDDRVLVEWHGSRWHEAGTFGWPMKRLLRKVL